MNTNNVPASQQEVFRQKALRRRDLAALPIEEKLVRLIRLQKIAYTIGRQVGREPRRPWSVKVQTHS